MKVIAAVAMHLVQVECKGEKSNRLARALEDEFRDKCDFTPLPHEMEGHSPL